MNVVIYSSDRYSLSDRAVGAVGAVGAASQFCDQTEQIALSFVVRLPLRTVSLLSLKISKVDLLSGFSSARDRDSAALANEPAQ